MASKGLGTLTLDLVAKTGGFTGPLDKAGRDANKNFKRMEQDAIKAGKAIGTAISVAFTAVGGAAIKLGKDMADVAFEIDRLSKLSNTSANEFQRLSAGAEMVGISQEKLADIFKDTQDKVGDFIQTGGGGLADFFENIAPKIGVTADQFRRLSGPDALQLYVSSLEKANLSQADFTFYMEAIASDSALLLPLLRNNGEAMQAYGDQAERAGAIISNETLQASLEFKRELTLLQQRLEGIRNELASAVLPILVDLAREFRENVLQSNDAAEAIEGLKFVFVGVVEIGRSAISTLQSIRSVLSGLRGDADNSAESIRQLVQSARGIAAIPAGVAAYAQGISANIRGDAEAMEDAAERYRRADSELKAAWTGEAPDATLTKSFSDVIRQQREELKRDADQAARNASPLSPAFKKPTSSGGGKSEAEKEAEALTRAYESMNERLREQVALFGQTGEAAKLRYELENGELAKLDPLKKAELIQLAEKLDLMNEEAEVQKKLDDENQRRQEAYEDVLDSIRTERDLLGQTAEYQDTYNKLKWAGVEAGTAMEQTIIAQNKALFEEAEAVGRQIELMDTFRRETSNALADVVTGTKSLKDAFLDMLDSITQKMAQMLADQWIEQLFGQMGTTQQGSAGGGINWAGLIGSFFGGGRAAGGAVNPGGFYRVNEGSTEMLSVGGRDYLMMGRNSGRVTPNDRMGRNGDQVVNFNVQGTVSRQSQDQIAMEMRRIQAVAAVRTGG